MPTDRTLYDCQRSSARYASPCDRCPGGCDVDVPRLTELEAAVGRLLAAWDEEEAEHGFPFSFKLRAAHREVNVIFSALLPTDSTQKEDTDG